jgi:ribokinase
VPQAVGAARAGAATKLVACLGRDAFADASLSAWGADGIDTGLIRRVEGASGVALIMVDASGENAIAVAPGANAALTPRDVDAAGAAIAAASTLLLQLEVPMDTVVRAGALLLAVGHAANVGS